ncbi:GNAT family N-acetyltransferase [Bacillus sp. Marseille-P3661]|uniref:GNAT family N-acetyltransferase n=1 Tax=Bacillus sp. Marseille-P3661 TaxID=1936234 RepID=UPI000C82F7C7|nr:GNAT family N-acetyltransferase [Bacillus sp. Marseille-P3661]
MLIRYKKSYEKLAMGLLSFMPAEKDIKNLQQTIKLYENGENWQLFLYKEEDIIGIVGIRLEEQTATLKHVSVNPSYRGQGKGKKMLTELRELLGNEVDIIPDEYTIHFFNKCK